MSFTERQQHCLEAMGLVAWVSRNPAPATSDVPASLPGDMSSDMPADIKELGVWLAEQSLANFGYKGSMHTVLGHPDASVLVVVQRQAQNHPEQILQVQNNREQGNKEQNNSELPLTGDAAQLFELMMRSIGLGRSDVRQCALAGRSIPAQGQSSIEQCVTSVCTPHTRAIIVLLTMEESKDVTAEAHHCRLAHSQLPVWRIAHPDILLLDNQRKRQAWQALKALQHHLAA